MRSRPVFRWSALGVLQVYLYFGILALAILHLPNRLWDPGTRQVVFAFGLVGLWRYSWWFLHYVRAHIYMHVVYPRMRRAGESLWDSGWRPRQLHFMMTTYDEAPEITHRVLQAILRECREVGVPATLFVGTANENDDEAIETHMRHYAADVDIDTVIVRQNKPGKRFAIGLVLRAMSRRGVGGDDPVVFLDGDSMLEPGCLRRCLPLFALQADMHALTTNERAVVRGPVWVQKWLDMRFAQRHISMQSHALAGKVTTLTGRMSVFRAHCVVDKDFIRTVEADHLDHWLWGRFRFLSGDDKSTWYWLLRSGARMLYVPDALVLTLERIEGNGVARMRNNLMRWSGNMLRNGTRAIELGPRRVGVFVWWSLVDQRIAMWTMLVGPIAALCTAVTFESAFFTAYVTWVALTRGVMSLLLFPYAGRIDMAFPAIMYVNQLANSLVKVYLIFRLPQQRWANRGNQMAYMHTDHGWRLRRMMASYLTVLCVLALALLVLFYTGLVTPPSWLELRVLAGFS